jgi:hypothetical protein
VFDKSFWRGRKGNGRRDKYNILYKSEIRREGGILLNAIPSGPIFISSLE